MSTITIDGTQYAADSLSDEAKATIGSIQFVQAELQRLEAQLAVLKTAETAYVKALKDLLPA